MKLRDLESILSEIRPFQKPKMALEQYATDAHIAARMIYTAESLYGDIVGKSVLDLGCGCGILSIACLVTGAARVLAVDIDADALEQFAENVATAIDDGSSDGSCSDGEVGCIVEMMNADVIALDRITRERFDTVVLNPPFGTKSNAGIDVAFLRQALAMLNREDGRRVAIYSMHKSSTREYIVKRMRADCKEAHVEVIAAMQFEIKNQFSFHRKEKVYVEVDLVRISIN